jgi:hypothetical protein
MAMTQVREPVTGLNTPTGRFSTWLVLGDSELALSVRARGWDLARRRWHDRRDVTHDDLRAVREWLDQELDDIFLLASKGSRPDLRGEALRVRVGVGRPKDVDAASIAHLLILLYHLPDQEAVLEWWTHDD